VKLHPDLTDLLGALVASNVEFLVVGGWAVSFHAEPRFTKDLDILIGQDERNLGRLLQALSAFGAPQSILEQARALGPEEFLFFGTPPARADVLRSIPGVPDFRGALSRAVFADLAGLLVPFIGSADLIAAKKAAGRPRDLLDVKALERFASRALPKK
jgi:hypothetical protein